MATIKEVVQQRVSQFGFDLSSTELDSYLIEANADGSVEYNQNAIIDTKRALYVIIPMLLLLPDVSEGQMSIKRNIDGIKTYYSILCKELGLEDKVNAQPRVVVKSLW